MLTQDFFNLVPQLNIELTDEKFNNKDIFNSNRDENGIYI